MINVVGPALRVILAEDKRWKLVKHEATEAKGKDG